MPKKEGRTVNGCFPIAYSVIGWAINVRMLPSCAILTVYCQYLYCGRGRVHDQEILLYHAQLLVFICGHAMVYIVYIQFELSVVNRPSYWTDDDFLDLPLFWHMQSDVQNDPLWNSEASRSNTGIYFVRPFAWAANAPLNGTHPVVISRVTGPVSWFGNRCIMKRSDFCQHGPYIPSIQPDTARLRAQDEVS